MKKRLVMLWTGNRGLGTLEIIIIIAVIVLIAFAFREWIMKWVTDLFNQTDSMISEHQNSIPNDLMP